MTLYALVLYIACGMALVSMAGHWVSRRVRVQVTDEGIEVIRRMARDLKAEHKRLMVTRTMEPFEPFTTCPGCGTPGYHLLAAPRQKTERAKAYFGEDEREDWWPLRDYEPVRFSREVMWRIKSGHAVPTRTLMVVDRECLNCDRKWLESADEQ